MSVRVRPIPRRFSALMLALLPPAPTGTAPAPRELAKTGRSRRASNTVEGCVACRVSTETTVTGIGLLLPFWITREPVTTTSSTAAGAGADCANADPPIARTLTLASNANVVCDFLIVYPLN
jgi:hypothetical protein